MGHCSHLGIEEREDVMLLARQHKSVREIARTIGRVKPTVSRELARNPSATGAAPCYRAPAAQRKHERRRRRCHRKSLMSDPERHALVATKLGDERWSPEQIEGRIDEERPDLAVSGTAICRAVWSGRPGCVLPDRRKMSRMLRHRSKEFARARQIQERHGIPVCFYAPHHPWEKGTDGNTSGLLRDFFPKGRSLDGAADAEAYAAYAMLNRRPRRHLGWKCPQDTFCSQASHLL